LRTFEAAHVDTGTHADVTAEASAVAVQPDGSHAGKLLLAVGVTLSIVILAMLVIWQVFDYTMRKERLAKDLARESSVLSAMRKSHDKILSSYNRVGSAGVPGIAGHYRIPVTRAMDLLITQPHRMHQHAAPATARPVAASTSDDSVRSAAHGAGEIE